MKSSIIYIQVSLFLTLLGSMNDSYGQIIVQPWPGTIDASAVDQFGQGLAENTSGVTYQPSTGNVQGFLWVVKNNPPKLHKMVLDSDNKYRNLSTDGWNNGKRLCYEKGMGKPDSEGITMASWNQDFVYVATEKKGLGVAAKLGIGSRRLSILRFDVSGSEKKLKATHEWDLADDIEGKIGKSVAGNAGWEAITWVPDTYLTSNGFYDINKNKPYDPDDYGNHYDGLFLLGLEQNGSVYVYALQHNGESHLISEFSTGWNQVVGLEFDRMNDVVWANCDDDCTNQNQLGTFDINNSGKFAHKNKYHKPQHLPVSNFEGIAFFSETQCASSLNDFFWVNDSGLDGKTIIRGKVSCPLP